MAFPTVTAIRTPGFSSEPAVFINQAFLQFEPPSSLLAATRYDILPVQYKPLAIRWNFGKYRVNWTFQSIVAVQFLIESRLWRKSKTCEAIIRKQGALVQWQSICHLQSFVVPPSGGICREKYAGIRLREALRTQSDDHRQLALGGCAKLNGPACCAVKHF